MHTKIKIQYFMIKKYFAAIAIAFLTLHFSPILAQVGEVTFFPKGKIVAKTFEPRFIGSQDGQVVFVEMTGRLRNKMELASYDLEQNELARTALTDDKDVECYGGYINGDSIDLLMAETKDNGMKVYRLRRDAKTLLPSSNPVMTLADFKGTQGDRMAFAPGISPNQELLAGLFLIGRENQRGEVQVALYNRELEEYWKMDSRCRQFDMFYVTDSGEVLLGNYTKGKFNLYILDGEHEEVYSFEADATFTEIQIARYANGKVFLVYTHSGKEVALGPGTMIDHIGVICFDTKSQTVKVDRHNIDKQEYNRLNNEKDDARVRKDDYRVMYMSLNQTLEDKDGCYAMLDQSWRLTLDGVPTEFNRMGMMVCRINDNGTFDWVKTFRVSNITSWEERNLASYRWVKSKKGPLLLWVESKSSYDNPEEKTIKDFKSLNSAGILSALLLNSDGSSIRQHYEISSKQALLGAPHLLEDNEYLLLIRGQSRGLFAKFKVQ